MNLLDGLMLAAMRPVRLHVDLLRSEESCRDLRAHVEFRMVPRRVDPDAGQFEIEVRMSCRVAAEVDGDRVDLLKAECVSNASYRPRPGFEISEAWFRSRHSDLGRQLYPLMQQRVEPLFAEYGFRDLRLPIEVVTEQAARSGQQPTH